MFAVVIPTLQRSETLEELLVLCARHPAVAEVVVINNAEPRLTPDLPKTTVLQQERNIFVNPAWNLGVRSTAAPWLAILNDDIVFAPEVFDHAAQWLRRSFIGIIGLHAADFGPGATRPRIHPEYHRRFGWGTAMFMRRDRYLPIPDQLRIFYGDDWLFNHQCRRNFSLRGIPVEGDMSSSSGAGEFNVLFEQDSIAWRGLSESPYLDRYRFEERTVRFLNTLRRRGTPP